MYLKHYGMWEHPFEVTPNPQFLYHSLKHREALATLIYGIEARRGFMALIGKAGVGKTTLLFELLERLGNTARTVFLFQTQCDSREFFHYLLSDLGIDSKGLDLAGMHEQLNRVLLAEARAGRPFVLIIDEAQNLADSVLETVRLLSDFETPRAKLIQILLAGQPQLAEKLVLPSLLQLRQRISLFARLGPLSQEETRAYIDHRLKVAGCTRSDLFTLEAMEMIASRGKGIPRDINNICFNALSLGFALQKKKIDSAIMHEVFADLNLATFVEEATEVPITPAVQEPVSRDVQPAAQEAPDASLTPAVQQSVSRAAQPLAQEALDVLMTPAVQQPVSPDVQPAAQEVSDDPMAPVVQQSVCRAAQPLAQETSDDPMAPVVQQPVSPAAQPVAQEALDVLMTPAVQQPVSPDVQPVAQDIAQSAPNAAAYRPKWLGVGRRPALWVSVLAATALATVGFLVFSLEKARIGERIPLAQTVSASNSNQPAPTVSRRLRTDDLSSTSAGPGGAKPTARGTHSVPYPLPSVQKATPRDSKLDGVGSGVVQKPGTTARKVARDPREKTVPRSHLQKEATPPKAAVAPLQVRTVLPQVALIKAEPSYSLQPPKETIPGPDSAEGTTAAAPASVKRVRVGSQAQAAKLVFQPKPEYPALAKSARVQGTVRLEAVVAPDGTVETLRVLNGHPLLVEAAEAAVARWRYQPTVLNGNPIEVVTEVDVDFVF